MPILENHNIRMSNVSARGSYRSQEERGREVSEAIVILTLKYYYNKNGVKHIVGEQ